MEMIATDVRNMTTH